MSNLKTIKQSNKFDDLVQAYKEYRFEAEEYTDKVNRQSEGRDYYKEMEDIDKEIAKLKKLKAKIEKERKEKVAQDERETFVHNKCLEHFSTLAELVANECGLEVDPEETKYRNVTKSCLVWRIIEPAYKEKFKKEFKKG